ncbi:MAG: response regulator [Magnetococcales bacterium]|nr:response regulator [Magnetococcales bacterium]MBF0321884.1 response regulator [Magnetococcales bacterium]
MKILIVDDELNNRLLLKKLLTGVGQCDMVSSGQDALVLFEHALGENTPYDLICMDIMMPGIDGLECIRRMRELEKETEVPPSSESIILMVSALDSPQTVVEAFRKGGCTDYLTKPISRDKLFSKLLEYDLISSQ